MGKIKVKKTLATLLALTMVIGATMNVSASAESGSNDGSNSSSNGGNNVVVTPSGDSSEDVSTSTSSFKQTNSVVDTSTGKVIQSTVPGIYSCTVVSGTAIVTPLSDFIKLTEIPSNREVNVIFRNTTCGPDAKACIDYIANALNIEKGPVFDFFVTSGAYGKYNEYVSFAAPVNVKIGIPTTMRNDKLEFGLIRVNEQGVKYLPDLDKDPTTVSFETDKTGVFMLVCAKPGHFNVLK